MAATLLIDGIDMLATYGAYPLGYAGLLQWPMLKDVQVNDWPDEGGIEANLSNPRLDARQLSLPIAVRDGRISDFLDFIYSQHSHQFYFEEIGWTKQLRLIGCSDFELHGTIGFATLILSDDKPMDGYTYLAPSTTINLAHNAGDLVIDGIDITAYGCIALDGAAEALRTYGPIKEALLINTGNRSGVDYDYEAPVHRSARVTTIPILLRAGSVEEFWRNYNALLYDLTRPGERVVGLRGKEVFKGYYGNMSVDEFDTAMPSEIWLKFNLTLNETSAV